MATHLKTRIYFYLKDIISHDVPHTTVSASHARGVRYFETVENFKFFMGAMNTVKEGRHYKKHIIVRQYARNRKVLQLYTYHFPTRWSEACVANREIIKEAQRRAHALEHDRSYEAIEWHIRFLKHYFRVFRGGAQPEPGLKRYSRFYQYTYVVIYRQLKAEQAALLAAEQSSDLAAGPSSRSVAEHPSRSATTQLSLPSAELPSHYNHPSADDISFDPIDYRPLRSYRTYPLQYILAVNST